MKKQVKAYAILSGDGTLQVPSISVDRESAETFWYDKEKEKVVPVTVVWHIKRPKRNPGGAANG